MTEGPDKDAVIQGLKVEVNYLHHKIEQLFHEIQFQKSNTNDPAQEAFQKRCNRLHESYRNFCLNGERRYVDMQDAEYTDEVFE